MLFNSIVYGPIRSRRLGVSLGVNLMPTDHKMCTFNCVYCECGWNTPVLSPKLPTREEVRLALEEKLSAMTEPPDVITFSGNGEPTLHPDFNGIIRDTIFLRNIYCPQAKVSVLSNSTQLSREDVFEALLLCDNRILKFDSAIDKTMRCIDLPVNKDLSVADIIKKLSLFNGNFTLQTCFLRGPGIDNTTPVELDAWYAAVELLHPESLMIYVIDRATPMDNLEKISRAEMEAIAAPLGARGFKVSISA